jgi:TolB-like protein/Tfp pilus assembly protein PilF
VAEREVQRRLAAIVSADVVAYTRLMERDEAGTHARLKARFTKLVEPKIAEHGGRVVKLMGDGLLAEFPSVVDAVNWAVEVQAKVAELSAEEPDEQRIEYRVGVNLGDVIVDGDDIFGDGVNVAARLQEIAEPGGVCISEKVQVEVRGKLGVAFADGGAQVVKNITDPIRVWRWSPGQVEASGAAPPPLAGAPLALPDKPSIAILPFDNMSGDPEQEFFADGMAEDIITALSRMPWFFVIARNSSFTYKGHAVDVKQVAHELGVQYVLEGSVRKGGSRIRITAQLIDAMTGKHVWAERYDREIVDIFALQDEVTEAIVGAVAPEFLSVEAKRAQRKDPGLLDAWECVMRGRALVWKMGREEVAEARKLFERAIQLAPSGEFGMSDLAFVHFLEFYYRWSGSPERSSDEMMRAAEKAVAVDDHDAWAHTMLGLVNVFARRWDEALLAVERAIELNPNFAPALGVQGFALALAGEVDEAIESIDNADRLSPHDSFMAFWIMGRVWANFIDGRYEEAVKTAQKAIRLAPTNPTYRRQLAASYAMMDRIDEAQAAIQEYLRLEPNHTVADSRKIPTKIPEHLERFLDGLRKAGLPE